MKLALTIAAFFISCISIQAQSTIRAIADSAAKIFMSDTNRVGLTIGIVHQGKIYQFFYGSLDRHTAIAPGAKSTFEIGSVSKTFAGTLLAQALLDGKIDLDADVRTYLTEDYLNLAYNNQPIRVRDLITHLSGLPAFLPDQSAAFKLAPDTIPFVLTKAFANNSRQQLLHDLHTVKLDTIPGVNYRYSNPNAQLVGVLLENVYHQSYSDLVKKYITTPAGMQHTYTERNNELFQLAKGYSATGKQMPYIHPAFAAAGGIYSTTEDMLHYLLFQLDKKNAAAQRSQQIIWGTANKYAMGLFWRITKTKKGVTKIWHTGGTFGFSSYCVLFPDAQTGIILLSNEMDKDSQGKLIEMADQLFEGLTS